MPVSPSHVAEVYLSSATAREAALGVPLDPLVYHTHHGWLINDVPLPGLRPNATPEQVLRAAERYMGRKTRIRTVNPTWCEAGTCKHHQGSFLSDRRQVMAAYAGNPGGSPVYDVSVDHGYDQPLAGGTDVMKRLQNRLLEEQGREPRPTNPRLAAGSRGSATTTGRMGRYSVVFRRLVGKVRAGDASEIARDITREAREGVLAIVDNSGILWSQADVADWEDARFVSFQHGLFVEVRGTMTLPADGPVLDDGEVLLAIQEGLRGRGFMVK